MILRIKGRVENGTVPRIIGAEFQRIKKTNQHGAIVRPVGAPHDRMELLPIGRPGGLELPHEIPVVVSVWNFKGRLSSAVPASFTAHCYANDRRCGVIWSGISSGSGEFPTSCCPAMPNQRCSARALRKLMISGDSQSIAFTILRLNTPFASMM